MVAMLTQHPETISWEKYEAVRKQLQTANQRIRQLEQELKQERTAKRQERELRRKKDFKPAEKFTLSELQRQIESPHSHKDAEGFTRFCYSTAATNTGMSESTPKRKIEAILEQWPQCPIEMKTITEHTDGKKIDRLYVKPINNTNLIQAAIDATLSEEHIRKQGGNKYICQNCGSVNVKIKRQLHCNCCGHEVDLEDTYPNGKLKHERSRSNLLLENGIINDSQEASNTSETGRSNLLLADDHESPAKNFDASLQLDDGIQETKHRQVAFVPDVDSNNPPLAVASSADHICTVKSWLECRRGTSRIIQATGTLKTEDKYRSKSEKYKPNLEAYITGKIGHIYGSWLRNPETGLTSVLSFDLDTPEHNEQAQNYLLSLARAGAAPVYWQRQRERGHLEIYFNEPVNPELARKWAIEICPDLADIDECFPCDGKVNRQNSALSWPLYQRIADEVYPCTAYAMLPAPAAGEMLEIDPKNLERLAWLITEAITPVELVEEYATMVVECEKMQSSGKERDNDHGGVIGIKPSSSTEVLSDRDLVKQVIADFNRLNRIEDMVELNKKQKFAAIWRGERTPSVALDRSGEFAIDYGRNGSFPRKLDAYEIYCLINNIDKKADLAERCTQLRRAEIKVVEPMSTEVPATDLFTTEERPVYYTPCVVCGKPKAVKRADGAWTCGTDHIQ